MMKFLFPLLVFLGLLGRADRLFFKKNNSFSSRFLFSSLSHSPLFEIPSPTEEELSVLDMALKERFYYLGKGAHCYAFASENGEYVIKFHRFASHMRVLPWLNHPLSYWLKEKRRHIKQHNEEKLTYNLLSYKNSYKDLREETGALFLHINKTRHLARTARIVDAMGFMHNIPLDTVTFILQRKAKMIYPSLAECMKYGNIEGAQRIIRQLIDLMIISCQKGYADNDPLFHKNHGLLKDRAIHIDMGDLTQDQTLRTQEAYIPYIRKITSSLQDHLSSHYPDLLPYYNELTRHN